MIVAWTGSVVGAGRVWEMIFRRSSVGRVGKRVKVEKGGEVDVD